MKAPKTKADVIILSTLNLPQEFSIFMLNLVANPEWTQSVDKDTLSFTNGCIDSYRGIARKHKDSNYLDGYEHMTSIKSEYRKGKQARIK